MKENKKKCEEEHLSRLLNSKSVNPSKRHRDRLNKELDNLVNLLPFSEDVIRRLDKLSILRLSVSYLRNKSYFQKKNIRSVSCGNDKFISNLIHQGLNSFILVTSIDGMIFYVSEGIKDKIGYSQSQLLHQRVETILHEDDKKKIDAYFKALINYEEKFKSHKNCRYNDIVGHQKDILVRFKSVLDGSPADVFKPFHMSGTLRRLFPNSSKITTNYALFSICTPAVTTLSVLEIQMENNLFCTKNNLDLTFVDIDIRGKELLGYSQNDIYGQSSYVLVHQLDIQHLRCKHTEMAVYGWSTIAAFRFLNKKGKLTWVSGYAKVHYSNGKPDYVVTTNRLMSDEEGMAMLSMRDEADCKSLQDIGLTEPDNYSKALELGFPDRIIAKLGNSSSVVPLQISPFEEKKKGNSSSCLQSDVIELRISPFEEKKKKDFSSCQYDNISNCDSKSDVYYDQYAEQKPEICPPIKLFENYSNLRHYPYARELHVEHLSTQSLEHYDYSQCQSSNFVPVEYEEVPPNVSLIMPQYDLSSILRSQAAFGNYRTDHVQFPPYLFEPH
ncbi:aryl hydrocarbon receptor-like isoform X2 [Hydra vulgaris]|uniref:Aryl hydrocarbon receptor-like isoform X2 n=1 Tax=Hydra vulgaris TaxID=6087 RepID=A0ABM4C234_HYDVU